MISSTSAQKDAKPKNAKPMAGSAAKGAISARMAVASDLDQRLARFREREEGMLPRNERGPAGKDIRVELLRQRPAPGPMER
jgi:hypothetical protein